jgi:tight adherence protein B
VAAVQQRVPVDEAILAEIASAAPTGSAGWRGLAAAWRVATDAGAPLAPTLDDFAASLRDLAQTSREVQVALAAPIATAKMVMALPAVGVLFGLALGFDTVGTLFGTPVGLGCLFGGVLLMLAARRWNRRLVRGAEPAMQTPGLAIDLVAIAVSGGASTQRAMHAVEVACDRASIELTDDADAFSAVFSLSTRAGVPAAALLRSEAAEARRRARSDGARRAATLSVTLMLPLGLCILPAFMLLGVAPLLIAVISSTVAGL